MFHEGRKSRPGPGIGHVMALSELAAIAAEAGEWEEASRWISRAR